MHPDLPPFADRQQPIMFGSELSPEVALKLYCQLLNFHPVHGCILRCLPLYSVL